MAEAIREAHSSQPQSQIVLTMTVQSPASGEAIGEVPVLSERDVRDAVERVRFAQRSWGRLSVEQRAERVSRIGDVFLERVDELVDVLVREAGKARYEAL